MILCKKDDEDKGSSLQNEVNWHLPPLLSGEGRGEVRKIESSAEALRVCHHPSIFPSRDNFAHNTARVIARSKGIGLAKKIRSEKGLGKKVIRVVEHIFTPLLPVPWLPTSLIT